MEKIKIDIFILHCKTCYFSDLIKKYFSGKFVLIIIYKTKLINQEYYKKIEKSYYIHKEEKIEGEKKKILKIEMF